MEAYTKDDMQNNKYIFSEQQKIAIKLSRALEVSYEDFIDYLCQHRIKNFGATKGKDFKGIFPSAYLIYHKDYHFLEQPLIKTSQNQSTMAESLEEEKKSERDDQYLAVKDS